MDTYLGAIVAGFDHEHRYIVRLVQKDIATANVGDPLHETPFEVSDSRFAVMPYRAEVETSSLTPIGSPERALPQLKVGDVVLARNARGWPLSNGATSVLFSEEMRVIGNVASHLGGEFRLNTDEAIALFKEALSRSAKGNIKVVDEDGLDMDSITERVSREKDEALVMSWQDYNGDVKKHVLHYKGAVFYDLDSQGEELEAAFKGPGEPGLWLFKQGSSGKGPISLTGEFDLDTSGVHFRVHLDEAAAFLGLPEERAIQEITNAFDRLADGDFEAFISKCRREETVFYTESDTPRFNG